MFHVGIYEFRAIMNFAIHYDLNSKWRCRMTDQSSSSFWKRPGTRLGWWAVGLAVAGFVLGFAWSILPGGGLLGLLCGLVGGVLALIAVIRQHERSWLVFLSILSLVSALFFLIGEFLIPH
jgi:multisubunit Na+/H+ antiporter MnhB subunit